MSKRQALEELKKPNPDPLIVGRGLFDTVYWQKQEEIIRSVWANKRTTVKSCNSGGKSRISAEIALLWLICIRPSRVITTAPTWLQVTEILWKEIHALHSKLNFEFDGYNISLGGKITEAELDLGIYEGHSWQAIGVSTNEENRMQGFKSPHLLVILDEACGVDPIIWRAINGLLPERILAIGNPIDPVGEFYNSFQSDLWNKITINAFDAIEWQKENQAIPGLVTREWVEEMFSEYGKNSPFCQARVFGEFPEDSEFQLIKREWVDKSRNKDSDDDEELDVRCVAADIATKHGQDETVTGYRYGNTIPWIKAFKNINTGQQFSAIRQVSEKKNCDVRVYDADGVGYGLESFFEQNNLSFIDFHGGNSYKAMDERKFRNLRSQFYFIVAKKFENGMYSLKDLPEKEYQILKNQLCAIHVKVPDGMGRAQIETKEEMHKRGVKSPDYADTFMMMEYGIWMGKQADGAAYAWR